MVRETRLCADNLIAPFFVCEGRDVRHAITSMPGQYRFSVDHLVKEAGEVHRLGVPAVVLFGIPASKDEAGSQAAQFVLLLDQGDVSAASCKPPDSASSNSSASICAIGFATSRPARSRAAPWPVW